MNGSFPRSVLVTACRSNRASSAGWQIEQESAGPDPWIGIANVSAAVPAQGWKLHVSASLETASEVLSRALPVLMAEPTAFKVASSLERLATLNRGEGGPTQVGKFITVYPVDDPQAVRLAVALDRATADLHGFKVPSDRPLRPGSLVHYRFGAFKPTWVQTPLGEVLPAITAPDGTPQPDRRLRGYSAPPWASDPF
ncbi:MAG: hypothetical protein LC808_26225, partial [Actinobacteria bacterium]|nr:hypothetical protein [Actinomycetota bacterium]